MRWIAIACLLVPGAGCRQALGLESGVVIDTDGMMPDDATIDDAGDAGDAGDASMGHDEDGDGVPDLADNCPATRSESVV